VKRSALFAASAIVAASILLTPWAVASPSRTRAQGTYVATLTGWQRSVATRSGTVRDELDCRFTVADGDRQMLEFTARRTVRLTLEPGARLPQIGFAARVVASGSRHRSSIRTAGDPDICESEPPRTSRCNTHVLRARLTLRPVGSDHVVLDGSLAEGARRLACATTLTKPDAFPFPFRSRVVVPTSSTAGLRAQGRLHARGRDGNGVTKTTDVRWTLVLAQAA
jgi:hypothetical protein